ncbi:MAG: hypothetical protein KC657_03150 [Myxococcales bacterium]|nr:hypothetical protein [Myxococcales bacterium]
MGRNLARAPLFLALLLAACSSKSEPPASEPPFDPTNPGDGGGGFGPAAGDAGARSQCAESTKLIYVVSEENTLYSFTPETATFKSIGLLRCDTGGASPTSMAVDREGYAWVRHSDASLWRVSTQDASCTSTKYAPGQQGIFQFGMGFATETSGSVNERLFIADSDGSGLGQLDLATMKLTRVGEFDGALQGRTAELTGTGEGKLYGFFVTTPAQIAEISKGTGQIKSAKELPGVNPGNAWAFAFYGGDFYIFTSAPTSGPPLAGGGSDVRRYRPSTGAVELVKQKIGFKIVGAGVSTCAPTTSPR